MSVSCSYTGGLGNNLFQYVVARLFAEKNDLIFDVPFCHGDPGTIAPRPGRAFCEPVIRVGEHNIEEVFDSPAIDAYYDFSGFFQQAARYYAHRDLIKSYFLLPAQETNTRDIVVHVRHDDYGRAHRIHWSWYREILKQEHFEKLYIVAQNTHLDSFREYVEHFVEWSPVVVSQSAVEDLRFISSFDRILTANSTFSWWATFFGRPSKVYTFKRWLPIAEVSLHAFSGATVVDGPFLETV